MRSLVGSNPGYRDSARELFAAVPDGVCEVILDFSGVEFISRGFADELLRERLAFQSARGVLSTVEHANEEVRATLNAVLRTQDGSMRVRAAEPVRQISSRTGLEDLLLNG
ncbi:MAG TPA: DUF4325 domain-containing protein [Flavobacteriales bacterium]|nr:DUF4325 domain-containing protein [Flavobacteriales bacterium]HMR28083.1 DUF4325 domain-containing protein [Flavobacteriales bacterium]